MENPNQGRIIISESLNNLEIIITKKKNFLFIIFGIHYLALILFGLIYSFSTFLHSTLEETSNQNVLNILLFLTPLSFVIIKSFIWNIKGKEKISVNKDYLEIDKKGMLFSKPELYNIDYINNIRIVGEKDESISVGGDFRNNIDGIKVTLNSNSRSIVFENNNYIIKFGYGLNDNESKYILNTLKQSKFLNESKFYNDLN